MAGAASDLSFSSKIRDGQTGLHRGICRPAVSAL